MCLFLSRALKLYKALNDCCNIGNGSGSIFVRLLKEGTEIGCEQLVAVKRTHARAGASSFEQDHAFVPARIAFGSADGLSVVSDCRDEAELTVSKPLQQADEHVLNLPLMGYDPQLLKVIPGNVIPRTRDGSLANAPDED